MGWLSTDKVILTIWLGLAAYFIILYIRSSADPAAITRHGRRFIDWRMHAKLLGYGLSFCRRAWPLVLVVVLLCAVNPVLGRSLGEAESDAAVARFRMWLWTIPGIVVLPFSAWAVFQVSRRRRRWPRRRFLVLFVGALVVALCAAVCSLIAAGVLMANMDWLTLESRAAIRAGVSADKPADAFGLVVDSARGIFLSLRVGSVNRFLAILSGMGLVGGLPWLLAIVARTKHRVPSRRRRFLMRALIATAGVCIVSGLAGVVTAFYGGMSDGVTALLYVFWLAPTVLMGALAASYLVAFAGGRRASQLHAAAFAGFPAVFCFVLLFRLSLDFEYWIVLGTVNVLGPDYAHVGLTTSSVWRLFRETVFLILAYTPFFAVLEERGFCDSVRRSLRFWHRHLGLSCAFFIGTGATLYLAYYAFALGDISLSPVRDALTAALSMIFVAGLARRVPELVAREDSLRDEATIRSPA